MHETKNPSIGVVGVLTALLTAVVAPTSAQAVSAPTTSPAAASRVFQSNPYFDCAEGYACAVVPYGSGWYIFKFYVYATYNLSYWNGEGGVLNNQTGGAAMRFYDVNGAQVGCLQGNIGGVAHYDDSINWTPIYKIRLTSSLC